MNQQPQRIDPEFCREATERIVAFLASLDVEPDLSEVSERYREVARRDHARLCDDIRNGKRREQSPRGAKCVRCQYRVVMAGAAITTRPCGLCVRSQQYGSTNAGVVCIDCAQAHGICSQCGGDVDGNQDRTDYPTSPCSASADVQFPG